MKQVLSVLMAEKQAMDCKLASERVLFAEQLSAK